MKLLSGKITLHRGRLVCRDLIATVAAWLLGDSRLLHQ
jgi:hypothetical protein